MKTKFNRLGIVGLFAVLFMAIGAVFANTIFRDDVFQSIGANNGNIAIVSYESDSYNDTGYFIFGNASETGNYNLRMSEDGDSLTCHEKLYGYYINPFWGSGRVWPLHSGTLETISASDSNFEGLNVSGGLFTSCTNEGIDPYAVFGYLEYTYQSSVSPNTETGFRIRVGISGLNTENPSFDNTLFLTGGGNGSDLSASGWIYDSISLTGIVTPYSEGNFSNSKPVYLGDQSINFEFLEPAYKSGDNMRYTTSGTIKIKLFGVTGYHWQLNGDLVQSLSGIFETSSFEADISFTDSTGNKTVNYSVFVYENGAPSEIYSNAYQIILLGDETGEDPAPGTESGSISCTWGGPTPSQILTGEHADFTVSCSGSDEIIRNINNSSFEIIGYNGGNLDIVSSSNTNEKTVEFTAGDETGNAQIIFKENVVCLTTGNNNDDRHICNESITSNSLEISGSNNSGGSGNGSGEQTETGEIPSINITQPATGWSTSKTIKATATNYSGFQYVVTNSDTCTESTDFSNPNTYDGNDIILSESYNGKYLCFKAQNNFGTKYARSNKIEEIDSINPVCTWGTPTKLELHVGETGSITLTCVDTGSKISGSSISYSDLWSSNQNLILGNPVVGGDSANKTFSFTYYANEIGNTTIGIGSHKVFDNAGNSNSSASSQVITVIAENETGHNSSSCERLMQFTQTPYSSWTQSDTVEVELFCGSTGRWAFSTVNVGVDIWDGTGFENGHLLLTTTGESFNGKYVCVYAQTGERVETGCTNYPFKVDAFHPEIDLISPNNGTSFESGNSVTLSRSGSDITSGISGYTLEINKPNGENIVKYFGDNIVSTGIIVNTAGRWYRSVSAYDQAGRISTKTRFFNVTYTGSNNTGSNNTGSNNTGSNNTGNNNTGNNNTGNNNTGSNNGTETGVTLTGFYLISPALFDRLSLGSNITFKWQAGELNSGYRITIEKIGGGIIYSGSTTETNITLNSGYFSTGSYSWSVEDIATDTTKTIPLFYIVDIANLPDLKVDQFEFNEITNADINEYYKSNGIIIDGLEDGWYNFAYLKDNKGALFINGEFVGTQGLVRNEDKVRIELLSSSGYDTTVSATLIVGSGDNLISGDFKVTTKDGISGWEDPLLTPFQRLWGMIFVDSLVEMYQNDPDKLATFLSTFMQLLQDKSDYYAQEVLNAQADGNEELVTEYKTYKNAVDFLYTIVAYRYDHIKVEDRTVYIAPNGKQYLVEYNEDRMAYTSPDFARPKYFPTRELFTNHIDMNNPAVGKWGIVGNVITTHNGKVYTIYETNGKWTSSNFKTAKYFDTKEDIINHILANNPASNWNHTVDPDFQQVVYTAPNGKVYKIFKTSSKGNNPNMYSSYNFVDAKYFTSLEAAKKFINQNNKK